MGRTTFGIVSLAALDLRRRPDHRSELRSQLLMGEVVTQRALGPKGRWWEVRNAADGYVGWVRAWGLIAVSRREGESWRRRAKARVIRSFAEVREGQGQGALVTPLFWNGRVIPGVRRGANRNVRLPDGREGWVQADALRPEGARRSKVSPKALADRIKSLLGTPYLWGGRTALGLDCSGFTQQVLAEHRVRLPRDAEQQFRASRPVRAETKLRLGDLAFFAAKGRPPSHVGLALGGDYYAHAQGSVRISSLDPDNPLYEKPLAEQFVGYRRPPGSG